MVIFSYLDCGSILSSVLSSVHVLPAWVSAVFSSFHPAPKNMLVDGLVSVFPILYPSLVIKIVSSD